MMYFIGIKSNVRAHNNEKLAISLKAQTTLECLFHLIFTTKKIQIGDRRTRAVSSLKYKYAALAEAKS